MGLTIGAGVGVTLDWALVGGVGVGLASASDCPVEFAGGCEFKDPIPARSSKNPKATTESFHIPSPLPVRRKRRNPRFSVPVPAPVRRNLPLRVHLPPCLFRVRSF
jgi:hypothetical protein